MTTEIIAEIAQAHEGSLGILHSYIDALAGTGVTTVKFQMHIAAAESSRYEQFRVNFSYEDATRYDYWKRMEFTREQWAGIMEHCKQAGLRFLCSPFSVEAFELLESLGVERYKVASGEVFNKLLLKHMANSRKPILLSSGMSTYDELADAVKYLHANRGSVEALFQCTTAYPTPADRVGLNVLGELRERFGLPVGLSDHSGEIWPGVAAVLQGASKLEFHVVFDKRMFGPDAKSSLDLTQVAALVDGVRFSEAMRDHQADKTDISAYSGLRIMFGKSLSARRTLKAGHVLGIDDLETRKPGDCGIPASEFENIIGSVMKIDLEAGAFITPEHLQ
jgi:N-acetylneuraminate synthase